MSLSSTAAVTPVRSAGRERIRRIPPKVAANVFPVLMGVPYPTLQTSQSGVQGDSSRPPAGAVEQGVAAVGACAPLLNACAQHGCRLGGASPPKRRPSQLKRTATAKGRPIVGRKQGAKPRADEQEPDRRRRQSGASGRVATKPRWSKLRLRRSGGRAGKEDVLTWGDLALRLKGRRRASDGARSQQRS